MELNRIKRETRELLTTSLFVCAVRAVVVAVASVLLRDAPEPRAASEGEEENQQFLFFFVFVFKK